MQLPFDPERCHEIFKKLTPRVWHPDTFALAHRYGFKCAYCDLPFFRSYGDYLQWSEDHVIPQKAAGSNVIENRVPCCKICNSLKNGWDPREEIGPNRPMADYIDAARKKFGHLRVERESIFERHKDILLQEGAID